MNKITHSNTYFDIKSTMPQSNLNLKNSQFLMAQRNKSFSGDGVCKGARALDAQGTNSILKDGISVKFLDINKLPTSEGLLVFGISMSRIGNAQSAENCFKYMKSFIPKILKPSVGLILLYADWLYMNSDEPAFILKKRYQSVAHSHKYEFVRLLKKHPQYIPKSISYITWNQLLLESKGYFGHLGLLREFYEKDEKFQEYIKEDTGKNEPTQNEINFVLEEILIFYLIAKGEVRLCNDYVQDKQKWILFCYPGKPLKSEIYLFQKNIFKLKNPDNAYETCFYDLEEKRLYDYSKIDLENLKL